MDEKVLKLFAEVGPNAQEALNSYINLQWAEFIVSYGFGFSVIAIIVGVLVFLVKQDWSLEEADPKDKEKIKRLTKVLEDLKRENGYNG